MRKKISLGIILALMSLFLTGCFKGDITVTVNNDGSSNVQYKILGAPMLADEINEMKNDASSKGMTVKSIKEKEMQGFTASKYYDAAQDMAGMNLFKGEENRNLGLVIQKGWFYDYYIFDLFVEGFNNKENKTVSQQEKAMQETMLSQVDFKVTINLPDKNESNNANDVLNEGKTLRWNLDVSTDNYVQAKTKVWHWDHIIIASISTALLFVLLIVGIYFIRNTDSGTSALVWKIIVGFSLTALIAIIVFASFSLVTPYSKAKSVSTQQSNSQNTKNSNQANDLTNVNKASEMKKEPILPLDLEDCTIGNIKMGDSMASVRAQMGKPLKESRKDSLIQFVYKDIEVEIDRNRNNTVVGVSSNSNNVYTKRNIHQTSFLDDVKKVYGDNYIKTSWGELDLYEYEFMRSDNLKYILRFAVNKSDNKVSYIGCRIPQ